MREFGTYQFDSFSEITSSKRIFYSDYVSSGIPFYRSKEIIELYKNRSVSNKLYISEEKFLEVSAKFGAPEEGDILLTSVGTLGIPYIVKKGDKFYFKDGNLTWIRKIDREKVLPEYIYTFLKSPYSKSKLDEITIGSTQPALTISGLKTLTLSIPSLIEQKAITSLLSSLDDKIDLLHRQNKTLESMAETLFRQWFIEECDNKWPLVLLGDFISCINGASYKSSELLKSQKALVTLKNFARDGSFRKDGFKEYVGHYKLNQVVVDKDIVVAHTDLTQDASLIGNPIYVRNIIGYDTLVISMDLVKVELNSESLSKDFLFYLLKSSEFKDYALSCSNGSSVIHLSKKALPNYTFNLPPYERIASFSVIAESYYEKMSINTKSIQTLETLRDTLLPKLMSGEVRVLYAEEAIASVA